jgi:FKBP12-rapamycin complex-associated protein
MWHEALEEASRMYFGEHNIDGMLAVLEPLHAMLERGAETIKENTFIQVASSPKLYSSPHQSIS